MITFDSDSEMTAKRRRCSQARFRFRSRFAADFGAGFAAFGKASALVPPLAFASAS